jgi:hypothetical protein
LGLPWGCAVAVCIVQCPLGVVPKAILLQCLALKKDPAEKDVLGMTTEAAGLVEGWQ